MLHILLIFFSIEVCFIENGERSLQVPKLHHDKFISEYSFKGE